MVPNLFKTNRSQERKQFIAQFEAFVKATVMRSIVENRIHQIYIDIVHESIQMRVYNSQSTEMNRHKQFIQVKDSRYTTEMKFLKHYAIKNFYINGIDEVVPGTIMQDVMFYSMPDGTSQAIIINIIDQDEENAHQDAPLSIVINPFYARISTSETFQKP